MPTLPLLAISDGATTINLLDTRNGFLLKDWLPGRPGMNQTRRNSLFAGGSVVRLYTYTDVVDTFVVAVRNVDQDTLSANCQELDRLLTKAIDYWVTNWATTPVWIEARGPQETNTRYAIIKNYQVAGEGNPYAQPFFSVFCTAGHAEMTIAVEHSLWQSTRPGLDTEVLPSYTQVYNGITYGRTATPTTGQYLDTYIASRYNEANLTHVWTATAGGVFGGNLVGAALPVNFLPITGGGAFTSNNDKCYFGCNTALADSGPFSSVVFDVGTASVYVATAHIHWEYWNGAWAALATAVDSTHNDGSGPFTPWETANHVGVISWEAPTDWVTTAINGITAYWVRAVVQLAGGDTLTVPYQRNRDFYAVTWPCVGIPAAVVGGDMPALARIELYNRNAIAVTGNTATDRIVVGLRSMTRGDFCAYWPFSDEQTPSQLAVPTLTPPDTTFGASITSPSGRVAIYAPAGLKAMTDEILYSVGAASTTFFGQYHLYLRYRMTTGATGTVQVQARYISLSYIHLNTPTVWLVSGTDWKIADLGVINYGAMPGGSWPALQWHIYLSVQNTTAAAKVVEFMDFVLIPADEWFADCQRQMDAANYRMTTSYPLIIDSTRLPKQNLSAYLPYFGTAIADQPISGVYIPYCAGPAILQTTAEQKLWFLVMRSDSLTTAAPWRSHPHYCLSVRTFTAQRYQSMRGAR